MVGVWLKKFQRMILICGLETNLVIFWLKILFCALVPCLPPLKNLPKAKLKGYGKTAFAKEISRQLSIGCAD